MPQQATMEIVQDPGFWGKPKAEQVKALAGVSDKFRGASPEAQDITLKSLQRLTGAMAVASSGSPKVQRVGQTGNPPPPPGPPSNGVTIGVDHPGLGERFIAPIREGAIGRAFGLSTESAASREEGKSNPLIRFEAATPHEGAVRGAAKVASSLTEPGSLSVMAVTGGLGALEGALGKTLISRLVGLGFSGKMIWDAVQKVPGVMDAVKKKDWAKARELATQGVLEAAIGARGVKYGVVKTPEVVTEAKGEPTPTHIRYEEDPQVVQRRQMEESWQKLVSEPPPPPPPPKGLGEPEPEEFHTGRQQSAAREKAAKERAESADPTSLWKKGYEGFGPRVAPEETGEIQRQQQPAGSRVGGNSDTRQVGGRGRVEIQGPTGNPDNVQYTSQKIPGVPAGATIIPRGAVPGKGFMIDVVDASGRLTQQTLPFQDSIQNMVSKGWMRKAAKPFAVSSEFKANMEGEQRLFKKDETFRTEPPLPPEGPARPVHEVRSQNLPATVEKPPLDDVVAKAGAKVSNEATEQAAREAAYMEEPSPAQPKAKPKTRAPKAAKPKAVTPQSEPPPPPSGPAEVQHVGPETRDTIQKWIDDHIAPKPVSRKATLGEGNSVKNPWDGVQVDFLDAKRQPIGSPKTIPGDQFSIDMVEKWLSEYKGAAAIRVRRVLNDAGKWKDPPMNTSFTAFLPQAKPPGPPEQVR